MKQLCPQACPKMSFRAKWGTIRVVTQWVIRHRRKRGGVLTRAVRGTGIPSAVRVRFLIEASSGLKRQQYPLRRLRLRRGSPAAADKTLHSSLFTPGCKVNNTLAHRANISHSAKRNISHSRGNTAVLPLEYFTYHSETLLFPNDTFHCVIMKTGS